MGFFASARGGPALPRALSSFHGRKVELARIGRLLVDHRLVTLTGPAGIGKTRLAVEIAAAAGRCGFVRVAELADPGLLPGALAEAARLPEPAREWKLDELAAGLGSGDLLLVLDGCEQLVDACAELTEALLLAAPRLRILATSREPLAVGGEVTWALQPLSEDDAAALFVARCALSRPDLELAGSDLERASRIAAALGGVPLALELGALRLRSLSLEDLEDRLDEWLRLPTGGVRTGDRSRQTLRAAAEASNALLGPVERLLLERVAVFRGPFSLAAAEAVCGHAPLRAADVLGLLGGLVERGLVVLELGGYCVPRAVRAYAWEALEATVDVDALRDRHADVYLERLEAGWPRPLELERENLRAALEWTHGRDAGVYARLCAALARHWLADGHLHEGAVRVQSALELGGGSPAVVTRLQSAAAAFALARGDLGAARAAATAAGAAGASLLALVEASTLAQALPALESTIPAWTPAAEGALALESLDLETAEAAFRGGVERGGLASVVALDGLAEVAARRRDHERALRLSGAAVAARKSTAAARPHWWPSPEPPPLRGSFTALGRSAARAAVRRGEAMSAADLRAYLDGRARPGDPSARELEIAALIAEGLTNRQIGARIHLSVRTVEGHVERLRGKLGFTTRARIAAWVAEKQVAGE